MHCCVCAQVCSHTSPPQYCANHSGSSPIPVPGPYVPPVPLPFLPSPYTPSAGPFTVLLTDADIERIAKKVVELLQLAKTSEA